MATAGEEWWTRPLASEPGRWVVTLAGGHDAQITASGYSENDGDYVFSMLIEGTPPLDVEVVRLPSDLVENISGG